MSAAGALMFYVGETQKQKTAHITRLESYWLEQLPGGRRDQPPEPGADPQHPHRHPPGTLLSVLDHTRTAMGARLLPDWLRRPLREPRRHRAAPGRRRRRPGAKAPCAASCASSLKAVHDMERVGSKTVMGQANARDLVALKQLAAWRCRRSGTELAGIVAPSSIRPAETDR
ncbi:MAG: hypothetical protein MZV70_29055 [Desulfobacterales bacterium]|nr:hypothetical protein [Desulfobacterales bacterium]